MNKTVLGSERPNYKWEVLALLWERGELRRGELQVSCAERYAGSYPR